jgi:hypothetical protein
LRGKIHVSSSTESLVMYKFVCNHSRKHSFHHGWPHACSKNEQHLHEAVFTNTFQYFLFHCVLFLLMWFYPNKSILWYKSRSLSTVWKTVF